MISDYERSFRHFLRKQFRARLARDASGNNITSVKGKTSRAELSNGATVIAELYEKCQVVKESGKSVTFAFQSGKKGPKSVITVTHTGDHDVLTMTMQ